MNALRRKLKKTIPLGTALAVLGMLLVPGGPASAAATGALMIQSAGHVAVTNLGSRPGRATWLPHLAAPHLVRDPAAHRLAKERAAASHGPGPFAPAGQLGPHASLFNNLNQPGLSVFDEGFCCVPPDPTGAVGPNHYVQMVNSLIGVYSKSNLSLLSSMDTAAFTAAPSGLTLSDPQIEWDFQANRWFYLAVAFATGNNFLVFGWSKTSDPSDLNNGWCRYGAGTGSSLNDFPKLGHDDNFLLFGSNVYDDANSKFTFVTANIWAYPKPALGDSSCPAPAVAYYFADATHLLLNADGTSADTPVPANTTASSIGGYIVAAHSPLTAPAGPRNRVMVWHMTKQAGLPALAADGDITVNAFDVPADAPQPNPLDTLDAQLTQAVARFDPDAGALAVWTQHTIGSAGGRSVVRWYELLPGSLTARQQGEIASPTDFVFNGAISPSINGNDAVVEYNRASSTLTPTIGAQSRQGSTPLGTMDAGEVLLGSSTDVDQDFSCSPPYGPPCRWGDYSGATPDPLNAGVVWGSNMVNGQSIFGFPQWTTQNFAISTGGTVSPNFSLSASPPSQTVTAGAGTSYSVTITPTGGFADPVTLSLSGLPSAASGSFNPNPAISASTLSVGTDPSTPAGTYPLTITGTSGSLSHTTSATLVVNAANPPDFSLSVSPPSQTVTAGAGTSYTVTITPTGGFTDPVTLSLAGLPRGASGSFNPNPAGGSSTLTVGTDTSAPAGTYSLTVTGTAGSLTHTASATLVINVPPDFTLGASPASRTVGPGATATSYSVTINPTGGFSGPVTLDLAGLPVGAAGSFSPDPATTASTLNVTIDSTTPSGRYTLTISGTSGSLNHTTTALLVVSDFAVSASPTSSTIAAGARTTYVVTIQSFNGFNGSVTLSVSGLPPRATAVFSPNPASSSSTLTIQTKHGRTPAGTYSLVISGTSGGFTRTTTVTLVIT